MLLHWLLGSAKDIFVRIGSKERRNDDKLVLYVNYAIVHLFSLLNESLNYKRNVAIRNLQRCVKKATKIKGKKRNIRVVIAH